MSPCYNRFIIFLALSSLAQPALAQENNNPCRKQLKITPLINTATEKLTLNRLQSFSFQLTEASGKKLDNEPLSLSASMPAHRHGMPTKPVISYQADNKKKHYLAQGLKFQMPGLWRVTIALPSEEEQHLFTWDIDLTYNNEKPLVEMLSTKESICSPLG